MHDRAPRLRPEADRKSIPKASVRRKDENYPVRGNSRSLQGALVRQTLPPVTQKSSGVPSVELASEAPATGSPEGLPPPTTTGNSIENSVSRYSTSAGIVALRIGGSILFSSTLLCYWLLLWMARRRTRRKESQRIEVPSTITIGTSASKSIEHLQEPAAHKEVTTWNRNGSVSLGTSKNTRFLQAGSTDQSGQMARSEATEGAQDTINAWLEHVEKSAGNKNRN